MRPSAPFFFFVPKDFSLADEYGAFWRIADVFPEHNAGIQTKNDGFVYAFTKKQISERIESLLGDSADTVAKRFGLSNEGHWDLRSAQDDVRRNAGSCVQVLNRPFDIRWTFYTGKTSGFMARPRAPLMRCGLIPNRILLTVRNPRRGNVDSFFAANSIVDKDGVSPFDNATIFPLFLGPETTRSQGALIIEKRINLGAGFLAEISKRLLGSPQADGGVPVGIKPEEIFNYVYALVHSPEYRSRYAEFLKIDFPRLPLTPSLELFRALAKLGGELVALHLMESPKLEEYITKYAGRGDSEVAKGYPKFVAAVYDRRNESEAINQQEERRRSQTAATMTGNVYINPTRWFEGVPEDVWNFHIGGYQVCEKWLKDRRDRVLSDEDIAHYQKVVVALKETIRLMAEIDKVIEAHGDWPGAFVTGEHS